MTQKSLLVAAFLFFTAGLSAATVAPVSYTSNAGGYPDDTGSQLTDGLYASFIAGVGGNLATDPTPPYPNAAYNWVGWENRSAVMTFDFGSIVNINTLTVHAILWSGAGVYLPAQVLVNSDLFTVGNGDGYTGFDLNDAVNLNFNGNWTGQFLTLELAPAYSNTWLFADEISFSNRPASSSSVPDGGITLLYAAMGLAAVSAARRLRKNS